MARSKGGCGCAIAVLVAFLGALGYVGYKFVLPWWQKQPPPPSGKELRVHVLDVGQGDSILIIGPEKVALIDAGDEKNGKKVVEALRLKGVQQIDYFIATHAHPDHIGGAAEVFGSFKVGTVLHNDFPPPEVAAANAPAAGKGDDKKQGKKQPAPAKPPARQGKAVELPPVKAYNSFKGAVEQAGAKFEKAEPERKIDLGGGAIITVLAPIPPLFTREQIVASRKGNESNANSIVVRLDYGNFSMLLTGDAEEQTEERLVGKEAPLEATILKVAHHGSKYATSEAFLKRVFRADDPQSKAAIISMSEFNRYNHPNQDVLNRLKAAGVKQLYRTDLQGEITVTTTGQVKDGKLYEVKTARETKSDLWAGREGEKNDSSSSGFITYGDYGPPPRQRKK
ncbi:MAG TPA: ComEC/Rec2 family competence protein [Pyrinomonadaceae bacterium]|nr:ComEC/Rec2 family competence protein [Pyrinomonadaceae bacterium]